ADSLGKAAAASKCCRSRGCATTDGVRTDILVLDAFNDRVRRPPPQLDESLSAFHSSILMGCRLSGLCARVLRLARRGNMPDISALRTLPVLPIKNTVLFPYIHMPFSVGRTPSLAALEAAVVTEEKEILVVCLRSSS